MWYIGTILIRIMETAPIDGINHNLSSEDWRHYWDKRLLSILNNNNTKKKKNIHFYILDTAFNDLI